MSFTKPKNKSDLVNNLQKLSTNREKSTSASQSVAIVDVSDTANSTAVGKEATVIDAITKKQTETPLTINKFVDQIKHKSTPVARKSLNFENESAEDNDPEQTLCPTSEPLAKSTQENEFMVKAFEQTPKSPIRRPLTAKNDKLNERNVCLAGSCLSTVELAKVKLLCRHHKWKYVDKYTDELTHLVVGVDDENKSQR